MRIGNLQPPSGSAPVFSPVLPSWPFAHLLCLALPQRGATRCEGGGWSLGLFAGSKIVGSHLLLHHHCHVGVIVTARLLGVTQRSFHQFARHLGPFASWPGIPKLICPLFGAANSSSAISRHAWTQEHRAANMHPGLS